MSEKQSLLSSNQNVSTRAHYVHLLLLLVGIVVVLYGGYDLSSRLPATPIDASYLFAGATLPRSAVPAATTTPNLRLSAPSITPVRLLVPSIGVDASVENVGKTANGAMATPSKFMDVAWYSLGSKPGAPGNAVFAGHVNNALTKDGVFLHLAEVAVGDKVVVADSTGKELTFVVQKIEDYADGDAPLQTIFSTNSASGVVLITCAGEWNAKAHSFDKRLVVYASLVAQ